MTYFLIFILFVLLSLIEYCTPNKRTKNNLFYFSALVLLLFCALKYGVGFDYFSYEYVYNSLSSSQIDGFSSFKVGLKVEYLFGRFFILLKDLGIDYIYAHMITIILTNLLMLKFISRYSKYKCFSILILYSWYFVYIFSTLRQGLAMSIILGLAIPFLEKEKYWKYYLVVFITAFVHTSSLVCLSFPLIIRYRKLLESRYLIIVAICFLFVVIPNPVIQLAAQYAEKETYIDSGLSVGALLNRLLACIIVYFLCKPKDRWSANLRIIYLVGFAFYLLLSQSELIASRSISYFKIYDIVLIPIILTQIQKKQYLMFMSIMCIFLGFMFMNIISAIARINGVSSGWIYPYVTIFEYNYIGF